MVQQPTVGRAMLVFVAVLAGHPGMCEARRMHAGAQVNNATLETDGHMLSLVTGDNAGVSVGADGELDVRGNLVSRTREEDQLAKDIIDAAERTVDCGRMKRFAWEYSNADDLNEHLDLREALQTFLETTGHSCKKIVSAFLHADGRFKEIADLVFSQTSKNKFVRAVAITEASDMRSSHAEWGHDKGRKKHAGEVNQRVSHHAGISEVPLPALANYFDSDFVHAKGIFERGDNIIADDFTECGAPFIAGSSGTMWVFLRFMRSQVGIDGLTNTGSLHRHRMSIETKRLILQLAAQLVLGGHHSWTEICIPLQEYHVMPACAVMALPGQEEPLCQDNGYSAYDLQMKRYRNMFRSAYPDELDA
jgi:hypothetical protein